MTIARRAALLFVLLMLSGCKDPVSDYVNSKFPPVSVDDQRKAALGTAASEIRTLDAPNLAFGASLGEVQAALLTKGLTDQGIKALRLSTDRQLVKADNHEGAFDCWLLGSLFKTLAVLCTQQRWPRVLGHTSSTACQKPRAPSATASSGPSQAPAV
jgi:hypothetical protein